MKKVDYLIILSTGTGEGQEVSKGDISSSIPILPRWEALDGTVQE